MSELYREYMLDHYHAPRNYGALDDAAVDIHMDNPTCGDKIHLTADLGDDGVITAVRFEGQGCVVSMAAASMLSEVVVGKTPEQVAAMGLEEIQEMLGGVRLSMGRIKCATLALNALQQGLKEEGEA
jgi:nitrogen fixation protein NifU and related proteins